MSVGVLVMAYGTPSERDELAEYYRDIRHGRPPSPEQLADLQRRYDAIGGLSPLNEQSAAQIRALQQALEEITPGRYRTSYGTKHAKPSIEAGIDELLERGAERVVGLVLAPHYSRLSVGDYIERAARHLQRVGVAGAFVKSWGEDPTLIELLGARVRDALARTGLPPEEVEVLFSAHSLPRAILEMGDPYVDELAATARAVAARANLGHYRIAWQSAGRTAEDWLSPDVLEVLGDVAAAGYSAAVICPAGFTSDHLEILYDLDIEAAARASELGLAFDRTDSLRDEPRLFAALARRIVELAERYDPC